jgi:hypothetical protein
MDSNAVPTIQHRETIRAVFTGDAAPVLTAQHGALMRRLRVIWLPIESGGPGIDFSQPFGQDNPTLATAMAILETNDETLAARLVAELGLLVAPYVGAGAELAPGRYALPADVAAELASAEAAITLEGQFDFTAQHAALLKGFNWTSVDAAMVEYVLEEDTETWPMPYVDGKYPYGECSYFQIDMARILGEPYALDDSGDMIGDADKDERLENLHYQTLTALQVFLVHATPLAQ